MTHTQWLWTSVWAW